MTLRPDEIALLEESGRCEGCGHLDVLHTEDDYGSFCQLGGCPCRSGELPWHGPEAPDSDFTARVHVPPRDARKFIMHRTPIDCLTVGSRFGPGREGWPHVVAIDGEAKQQQTATLNGFTMAYGCVCASWLVLQGHPESIDNVCAKWGFVREDS